MTNEVYTRFNKVQVTNNNLDAFSPENTAMISWASYGEMDIEFTEAFIKDLQDAVAFAKKCIK